ncbi:hypothetical protein RIEGSTA812A_PEG_248 [invertebrate metagenome]|uniref:Uncharacterized protein n=1 Tax=invertebrate metagenome TaxID=1711999 RepID=A0A484H630_9ZZZZ
MSSHRSLPSAMPWRDLVTLLLCGGLPSCLAGLPSHLSFEL